MTETIEKLSYIKNEIKRCEFRVQSLIKISHERAQSSSENCREWLINIIYARQCGLFLEDGLDMALYMKTS